MAENFLMRAWERASVLHESKPSIPSELPGEVNAVSSMSR